ncbi:MAG TPA: DUF6265 family protein [Sphingomonas sp.]|jgi:hypothetical protein|nr:DUF6265 family protein [Sphingomonas sp.]
MLLAIVAMLAGADTEPPDLAWLEGEWCTVERAGRQTCELWGRERGGTMLGTGQTVRDGKTHDFEFMRIVRGLSGEHAIIKLAFIGAPGGKDPVVFAWSPSPEPGVTFFNAAHDYPQRVRYWRQGQELHAEISLADGSKAGRWVYRRVR